MVSGSFDYSVMLWDTEARTATARLIGHEGPVGGVAVTRDGRTALSVGDDGLLILWDLTTRQETRRLALGTKLAAIAVAPDQKQAAAAGWDGKLYLVDLARAAPAGLVELPGERINAVAFTAAGTLVAAGHAGRMALWRAADLAPLRAWAAHPLGITAIATAGDLVATASIDRSVRLWDAATGEPRGELAGHDKPVSAAALSPDGTWLASGAVDGQLILWRVADRQALHIRRAHAGPVWSLAFRPDGRELLSGGADGLIRRWSVPDADPLDATSEPAHAAAEGAALFRRCVACHTLEPDGGNRAGPTLHALFGRRAGSLPGYTYSRALSRSDIIWTEETVARLFEQGPDSFTPGSKMPLQRLPDPAERAALIAFLKTATAPTGTGAKGAKP